MGIFDRIKEFCDEKNISIRKLEKDCHLSNSSAKKWNDSKPSAISLQKVADYLSVSTDYLIGVTDIRANQEMLNNPVKRGVQIPVLGKVAAGIPIEAIEEIIDWEEITPEMAKNGEYFALSIHGDSMEPKISEGDVVIVRKQPDVESGEIAIVRINGDNATCKRLLKSSDGFILLSLNPTYAPMYYSIEDIKNLPVEILGKVVELRAKF